METKLAIVLACLFVGCGLETAGQGQADDGQADIVPDGIEPDVAETDVEEPDILELAEVEPPPEAADEAGEDETDGTADEASPEAEDASEEDGGEEAEDVRDVTDESGEEDGEVADPCTPPEIPTTGLFLFFCIATDRWPTNLHLERRVDRSGTGLPDDPWGVEPGCAATDARSLPCEVDLTGPGTMIFGVHLTYAWACEHLATPYAHGVPRLWWNGTELVLGDPVWNGVDGSDGCQYTLSLPTP